MVAAEPAPPRTLSVRVVRQLDRHRETIGLWPKAVCIERLPASLDRYAAAKKGPRSLTSGKH